MSRTLSLNMIAAMHARETSKVPIFLLTIEHPLLATPWRLSTDPTSRLSIDPLVYGTHSRGEDYLYVGARVTVPDDKDRSPPTSKITIFDINQDLIPLVRSVQSPPPTVKMEIVLSDALNVVELEVPKLEMINVDGTRESLTFECTVDLLLNETYPAYTFNPSYFPGLFQ